jgi:hypothetical protein
MKAAGFPSCYFVSLVVLNLNTLTTKETKEDVKIP